MQMAMESQEYTQSAAQAVPVSTKKLWAGRVVSTLVVLFLLFDSIGHLIMPAPVVEAFVRLGYPATLGPDLGIVLLVCVAVYTIPRSAVLGAVLLTGYLGGATAANLRAGDPLFETLFPVIFGVLVWAGIFLRDDRLRAFLPVRR